MRSLLGVALSVAGFVLLLVFGTRNDFIVEFDGRRIVVLGRAEPLLEHVEGSGGERPVKEVPAISRTALWRIQGAYDTFFEWADLRLEIEGTRAAYGPIQGGRMSARYSILLAPGEEAVVDRQGRLLGPWKMGPVPGEPP